MLLTGMCKNWKARWFWPPTCCFIDRHWTHAHHKQFHVVWCMNVFSL